MKKLDGSVALNDVIFSIEKRVSKKGYSYYVLVAHANNQDVDCGFITQEQQFEIYKAGVDIR